MDYSLFTYINNLAGKWICLDGLAIFCATYLIYFLVAGAVLFLFLIKKRERIQYLLLAGISVILSRLVITELIRFIWHRPRPFAVHQVNQLLEHSASGSFPSGHITFLFALSAAICFFNKKIGWLFFIFSFLIGLSRVFVGIHYPFDILGGIIVGILSVFIINIAIKGVWRNWYTRRSQKPMDASP